MSEKDVQIAYGKGFEPLLKVLAGARRPGSWFSAGSLETPMPAIEVEGVGMLSFPVPPGQARKVIAIAAERAPYGRGDQTVVDETVRAVWQVSPAKLKIRGNGWATSLDELVRKIGEDLGCGSVEIAAEFYKLLVYEKGGFFLPHRDSEKSGGMFGTLVVALPSAHEGGDLVIRHARRETRIDLRGEAPSEIRYGAFYADCEHEVKPVHSGYRVCLVYNLIQQKRKTLLQPPDHRAAIAAATPLLKEWACGGNDPAKIVYLLEHHYTEAALSFSALKGADAALAQVLVPSAAQAECSLHLGLVHIEESGWAEHTGGGFHGRRRRHSWYQDEEESDDDFEIGEVCDGSYYVDQWRAPDDTPVDFGEIPIGEGEILPPGALDGEPPDERHFSEATGNEGASFDRTYLRAAFVLWPAARFDRICASAGPGAALARLEQLVAIAKKASATERPEAEKAVRRMAAELPPLASAGVEPVVRLSRLLTVLIRFGDPDLLIETAARRLFDGYDGAQNAQLVAAIPVLGAERGAELLASLVRERGQSSPAAFLDLWTRLAINRTAAKSRSLLDSVLEAILKEIVHYSPPERPDWARSGRYRYLAFTELDELTEARVSNPLTPILVITFLTTLHASPCSGKMPDAIRVITEKPDLFIPETVLLRALESIGETIPAADGPIDLWAHCTRYYLARSEHAPQPPCDWAQEIKLPGESPLIRELEAFARDPAQQVHQFRVRKDMRQQIHQAIDRAGLDMTHVTDRKGSPQTLVCTKTRATYERACEQYRKDISDMRRLLALPHAMADGDAHLAGRLRNACRGGSDSTT